MSGEHLHLSVRSFQNVCGGAGKVPIIIWPYSFPGGRTLNCMNILFGQVGEMEEECFKQSLEKQLNVVAR